MSFPRYAKYKDSGVEWLGDSAEPTGQCSCASRSSRLGSHAVDGTRVVATTAAVR